TFLAPPARKPSSVACASGVKVTIFWAGSPQTVRPQPSLPMTALPRKRASGSGALTGAAGAAAGAAAGTAAVSASFLPQAARVAVTARASRAGRRFIGVGLLGNRAGRIAKGAWG